MSCDISVIEKPTSKRSLRARAHNFILSPKDNRNFVFRALFKARRSSGLCILVDIAVVCMLLIGYPNDRLHDVHVYNLHIFLMCVFTLLLTPLRLCKRWYQQTRTWLIEMKFVSRVG